MRRVPSDLTETLDQIHFSSICSALKRRASELQVTRGFIKDTSVWREAEGERQEPHAVIIVSISEPAFNYSTDAPTKHSSSARLRFDDTEAAHACGDGFVEK